MFHLYLIIITLGCIPSPPYHLESVLPSQDVHGPESLWSSAEIAGSVAQLQFLSQPHFL